MQIVAGEGKKSGWPKMVGIPAILEAAFCVVGALMGVREQASWSAAATTILTLEVVPVLAKRHVAPADFFSVDG